MNCVFCNKPIRLSPSAAERAKKDVTGKTAKYYESLFTSHASCLLKTRHTIPSSQTKQFRNPYINKFS